jgi:hypothetical protein
VGGVMFEPNYKVKQMNFDDIEYFLNNYHEKFPHYHLYQIIPKHCYNSALAVVILEHDDVKGGEE